MTGTLFLVRHGEAKTKWGQEPDPGLSERGRLQATAVSDKLVSLLDTEVNIVSSPLLRARQTAVPLAAALGVVVEIDNRFREIEAPAALSERQAWIKEFSKQTWDSQSGSLHEWRLRVMERLLKFSGHTVIFTHFMILNVVVGYAEDRLETLCFLPDNGSITQLQSDGETLQLISLGDELQTVVN